MKAGRPVLGLMIVMALLFSSPVLKAQSPRELNYPSWVLRGLGERAFDQGEFAQALVYFRQGLERKNFFPEAERSIGRIFHENAEISLQRMQLEKAWELRDFLIIPEEQYEILYETASILRFLPPLNPDFPYQEEIQVLQRILEADEIYREARNNRLLESYNQAFFRGNRLNRGLDWLLFLYDSQHSFGIAAHQRLAEIYSELEAWELAVNQSLFAILGIVSVVRRELKTLDPLFEFISLEQVGSIIQNDLVLYRPIRQFLASSQLGQTLTILQRGVEELSPERPEELFQSIASARWHLLRQ